MENYNKNLFDRFLAGIAVVHVKTQDEYDEFMKLLESETSLRWAWGAIPTIHFGLWTGKRTCIRRVVSSDMITFGDISYYDSKGYEIIEFSDLTELEPVKAETYEAQKDVKMEEPKPILDKVEHDYLAAVIAPKRIYKYVDYIVKRQVNEFYVIDVHIKHTTYSTKMMLSYFKKSESMYEGMKVERQYTLKELGLEKE